ncbi:hypothetical protein D0T57_01170 [Dysgonomonas sp. 511]|nr:hypothetical protein [Dysgonomonas sp. 511]
MTTVGRIENRRRQLSFVRRFFLFRANDNSPLRSSELSLDKFNTFALPLRMTDKNNPNKYLNLTVQRREGNRTKLKWKKSNNGKSDEKVLHVLLFHLTPRSLQRERGLQATTRERKKVTIEKQQKTCYKCYFLGRYNIPVDELTNWFLIKYELVPCILFTCIYRKSNNRKIAKNLLHVLLFGDTIYRWTS